VAKFATQKREKFSFQVLREDLSRKISKLKHTFQWNFVFLHKPNYCLCSNENIVFQETPRTLLFLKCESCIMLSIKISFSHAWTPYLMLIIKLHAVVFVLMQEFLGHL
jgi:hypothetical protein